MEQTRLEDMMYELRKGEVDINESIKCVMSNAYISLADRKIIEKDENLYKFARAINANYKKDLVDYLNIEFSKYDRNGLVEIINDYLKMVSNNREGFIISVSDSVFKFVYDLLDIKDGDKILDLGSGIGMFLNKCATEAKADGISNLKLTGKEINVDWANISKMLLSMTCAYDTDVEIGDAINTALDNFDKGFVFPPFGMRQFLPNGAKQSETFDDLRLTNRNSCEWIFIDKMLSRLNDGGRIVALVTQPALFSKVNSEYRNRLLAAGLIEGIVELPQNIFPQILIKTVAIVFSKGNDEVKVIDGTKCFKQDGRRFNSLNYEELICTYNSREVKSKNAKELIELENLTPSIVLLDVKKPENGIMLKDVAEVILGCQYTAKNFEPMFTEEDKGCRILTSIDIHDGIVDWKNLQKIDCSKQIYDKYAVRYGDIVLTSKSSTVKTVVVDINPDEKILVTGGMLVIRPNLEKMNPTYIKIFLDSEEGKKALKSIQKGNIITTINRSALEEIYLPSISLEKQEEKASRYNDLLTTLNALLTEADKIREKIADIGTWEE